MVGVFAQPRDDRADAVGEFAAGRAHYAGQITEGEIEADVGENQDAVTFVLERSGRVEKLAVCALARRTTWDVLLPRLSRDARLAQLWEATRPAEPPPDAWPSATQPGRSPSPNE